MLNKSGLPKINRVSGKEVSSRTKAFVKAVDVLAGGVSRRLLKNKAIPVPSGTVGDTPTSTPLMTNKLIEEAVRRFDERTKGFMSPFNHLYESDDDGGVKKPVALDKQKIKAFLTSELTLVIQATRESVVKMAKDFDYPISCSTPHCSHNLRMFIDAVTTLKEDNANH